MRCRAGSASYGTSHDEAAGSEHRQRAGVIDRRKLIYDLWGDTVNTANRMESHGVAGEIWVTERVVGALDGDYVLEYRGMVEIKGQGHDVDVVPPRSRRQRSRRS